MSVAGANPKAPSLLASGGKDNSVILYDLRQGRIIRNIQAHTEEVRALAFTPDDKTLVSTSVDGTIKFWSVANQQLALTLIHDGGPVTGVMLRRFRRDEDRDSSPW